MAENSKIEWTDATWNPVRGCTAVSPGCANCYAAEVASRFSGEGLPYDGLAKREKGQPAKWTGKIRLVASLLEQPLKWKKPRRIFVNSMSDLFHPDVPQWYIHEVFEVIRKAHWHTFQVLTKRPERAAAIDWECSKYSQSYRALPNLWLGASVENQDQADWRIPHLLKCPAVVRFLSCEPLLGPLDLLTIDEGEDMDDDERQGWGLPATFIGGYGTTIDWVIVGGESGPNARPMHPDWARSIRDQCQASGVPFFFKQWGEWGLAGTRGEYCWNPGASVRNLITMDRVGKKRAGRLLDGREWNEFPEVSQ